MKAHQVDALAFAVVRLLLCVVAAVSLLLLCSGCTTTIIRTPDGYEFKRTAFLSDASVMKIVVHNESSLADGSKETRGMTMEGYKNEHSEGGKALIEGVVEGVGAVVNPASGAAAAVNAVAQ